MSRSQQTTNEARVAQLKWPPDTMCIHKHLFYINSTVRLLAWKSSMAKTKTRALGRRGGFCREFTPCGVDLHRLLFPRVAIICRSIVSCTTTRRQPHQSLLVYCFWRLRLAIPIRVDTLMNEGGGLELFCFLITNDCASKSE